MVESAGLACAGLRLWRARLGSRRAGACLDAELVGENSLGEAVVELYFLRTTKQPPLLLLLQLLVLAAISTAHGLRGAGSWAGAC